MIHQLVIGSVVIAVTIAVQAECFNLLSQYFDSIVRVLRLYLRRFANTGAVIVGVLCILFVHTVNVWIWALVYIAVGAFSEMEPALYFSIVSFTTVGFGDVILNPDWRLLSGLTAANGFLTFGWSTAYMVELVRRTA
jgi:hypothetical protein